jgi:hypothetical protein
MSRRVRRRQGNSHAGYLRKLIYAIFLDHGRSWHEYPKALILRQRWRSIQTSRRLPLSGGPLCDRAAKEASMVAKCANPECNCEFRELSEGRLFLLPPTHDSSGWTGSAGRLSDHCYWLCPECNATHTITRSESGVVVSARGPGSPYPVYEASYRNKTPRRTTLRSYTQTR